MFYLIIGALAIGIGGMAFAVMLLFQNGNEQVEDRLASLTQNGGRGAIETDADKPSLLKGPLDDAPGQLEEFVNRFLNLRKLLEHSGTGITLSKFAVITLATGRCRRCVNVCVFALEKLDRRSRCECSFAAG